MAGTRRRSTGVSALGSVLGGVPVWSLLDTAHFSPAGVGETGAVHSGEADARKTWLPGPPEGDMSIYEELGVRTIINAKGPSTRLSGGFLDDEVARAMVEASQHCVDIAELQAAASRVIAEITGSEAGYVTSGAAAGLLLGTAACVTGLDPARRTGCRTPPA